MGDANATAINSAPHTPSQVVFITELMSSGTLKEFCSKYPISLRQIKKYCRCVQAGW